MFLMGLLCPARAISILLRRPLVEWIWRCLGMQLILRPAGRIVVYVFADAVQGPVVANDVFPVVALPEPDAGCPAQTIDALG